MRAHGFTLLEVLIALALLALIGGLVLPIGLSRIAGDSFAQAQRQLESAVAIARADAQRRSVMVKLVATMDEHGLVQLWGEEHQEAPVGRDSPASARRSFVLELPSGIGLVATPAEDEDDRGASPGERDAEQSGTGARTLCVLMPDGTVVAAEPALLTGRDDRAVRITFNAWTGALMFTRFVRPDAGSGAHEGNP